MIAALLAEAAKNDDIPLLAWLVIGVSLGIIIGGFGKRSS